MLNRLIFALLALAASSLARADESRVSALSLAVRGECPAAAQIEARLSEALPRLRLSRLPLEDQARVVDEGDHYRVAVFGHERVLTDPLRRCATRAEMAAVLIAMEVRPAPPPSSASLPAAAPASPSPPSSPPPSVFTPASPPPGSPPSARAQPSSFTPSPPSPGTAAPAAPVSAPAAASRQPKPATAPVVDAASVARRGPRAVVAPRLRIEGGPAGTLSADGGFTPSGGGALHLTIGAARLAAIVGGAVYASATTSFGQGQAKLLRVPFDLGVRVSAPLGRAEVALDAGWFVGLLRVEGSGFAYNNQSDRLDTGVRVSPSIKAPFLDRVALVVALPLEVSVLSYPVSVLPIGPVGSTPRVWLGAMIGMNGVLY